MTDWSLLSVTIDQSNFVYYKWNLIDTDLLHYEFVDF